MTMLDPSGYELPPIPTKRYFTIGEVSSLCEVKPHVLRYWEQEFTQLRPAKRRGRRYFQRHEIELIRQIRRLLHSEGFTISGARERIKQLASKNDTAVVSEQDVRKLLNQFIIELNEVKDILSE